MIFNYIKISGRSILRNKLFSAINITGLAISLSVGLLMVALLTDLLRYDHFHKKENRIFRVLSTRHDKEYASTSVKAGQRIKETIPGIDYTTILEAGFQEDIHHDETTISLQGFWADEYFFQIFSFPLIKGNSLMALKEPYSIVLTENAARRLFPDKDPMGKLVTIQHTSYQVTGIAKDLPMFSHIRFEVLVSFATKEIQERENEEWSTWTHISGNYVYLLMSANNHAETLQAGLNRLCDSENTNPEAPKILLSLQPLNKIVPGKVLGNTIGPDIPEIVIWILGGLSGIVIFCACFNYTSLSIARSVKRAREIGLRKIIGAKRVHIFGQFLTESIMISGLSVVLSFFLFLFLRPHLFLLDQPIKSVVRLSLSPKLIFYFVALSIITGIIAGTLPALFFSKINAVQSFRNLFSIKAFHYLNLRKSLIVLQYIFSLIFISVTVLGYRQYRYFINFDLGFTTDQVINIDMQGNNSDPLVAELRKIPEIIDVCRSSSIISPDAYAKIPIKYGTPPDSIDAYNVVIDERYLPLHGFKILAGKNFEPDFPKNSAIVNEQFLKYFHLKLNTLFNSPDGSLVVNGKKFEIIGVVKDFYYGGVERNIEPFLFMYSNNKQDFVSVKVYPADASTVLSKLNSAWRKIDSVHPLKASFYTDQLAQEYADYSAIIKIIGFLAVLTISIAALGLFGMVVYSSESRIKEISIRKILGSSEGMLIYLLSKGFLFLISIAIIIALPIAYLFFDKIVLPHFAYHAPVAAHDLIISVCIVLSISFLMIGVQTIRIARSNPTQILKNE